MQNKKYMLGLVPILLFSSLLMLLLSACGTSTLATVAPPVIQGPTLDPTLARQGSTELQTFQNWIALMKQYGGDVKVYQKQYVSDQHALQIATTDATYKVALKTLSAHINVIQIPALQTEASQLHQQLQQKASAWSQKHTYYDSYDGVTYNLGYEYGAAGSDGMIQDELSAAQTVADYQQAIEDINMYAASFNAMVNNANDKTPYTQQHATDMQLMKYYHASGLVVVVSLQEEAMRVYQDGQLIKVFQATTGRPSHPSLPGFWHVEDMESPTVFKSGAPVGSPDYYPDTKINYAMQYHSDGYFLHDSWWRADYGPGTNFPHQDASGNDSANQGSHGCVNLTTDNARWLYNQVQIGTNVIIY